MDQKTMNRMRNKARASAKEQEHLIETQYIAVANCASSIAATQLAVLLNKIGPEVDDPTLVVSQEVASSIASMSVELATLILMMSVNRVTTLYKQIDSELEDKSASNDKEEAEKTDSII